MKRRALLAVPALLAGCGLSERPYAERRQWPLAIARPDPRPLRAHGRVLLVRAIRAGPGLDARGLQAIQPDGSIRTEFYEEWAVAPAEGVEDALRRWLGASGLFAAVIAPGSRLAADLTLEGELDALWTEPDKGIAHASLAIAVLNSYTGSATVRLARTFSAAVPLAGATPPDEVAAMRAALADVFRQIELALASTERRR
ncbi:MAG: membrane integrity-associated transporter subunit PqiC [Acetobacteraceae bacterium]|nr:membrane integrity-associated transporter subunit PqiC [Acetobacteraceae bacterium]